VAPLLKKEGVFILEISFRRSALPERPLILSKEVRIGDAKLLFYRHLPGEL